MVKHVLMASLNLSATVWDRYTVAMAYVIVPTFSIMTRILCRAGVMLALNVTWNTNSFALKGRFAKGLEDIEAIRVADVNVIPDTPLKLIERAY